MKNKFNIQSIQSLIPFLGLVILIVFSPCKVRNYIQSELEIPLTEVTNKSISTASNCNTFESVVTISSLSKSTSKTVPSKLGNDFIRFSNSTDFLNKSKGFYTARNQSISAIPLYILYQNRKVFS